MRQFNTAVKEAQADPEVGLTFKIDDRELVAFQPDPAQMAVLVSGFGRHSSEADKIATFIDFFTAVLDTESSAYIVNRLLDRKDSFGLVELADVGEWMLEEWGGFPTQPSSGSPQSRSTDGRTSKRPTTKKTSSGSRSRS